MKEENNVCQELTCGRPLYDNKHCIFHSEDKTKGREFITAFWEEYEKQEKTEDPFNFRGFVFPRVFDFMGRAFKKKVYFIKSKFLGDTHFSNVSFLGDVLFSGATFSGGDLFRYTKFAGLAFYDSTSFSGAVCFDSAMFSGTTSFVSATFLGETTFRSATFSETTSFDSATFSGYANFKDTNFSGNADFKSAKFIGNAEFNGAKFSKDANFGRAEFSGYTQYSEKKGQKIVHRGNTVQTTRADPECIQTSCKADFNGAEFCGQTNFISATFHGCAEFEGVCFSKVEFGEAHFCNISKFSRTKFEGEAIFQDVVFQKCTSFLEVEFIDDTSFRGAELRGESNFKNAKFYGTSVFEYAKFCTPPENAESSKSSKTTSFLMATFYGKAFFNEAKFFGETTFQQTVFTEVASFVKAEFHKTSIFAYAKFNEDANFEGIIIENIDSFYMKYAYFFNVIGLFEYIEENDKLFKPLRKISRTLKTEFVIPNFLITLGERAAARYPVQCRQIKDDMYLLDKKERISRMHGVRKKWHGSLFFLWWLFGDYGRSFWKWAIWSLGFALSFAIVFYLYFLESPSSFQTVYVSERFPFFSFFYYSVVTFTTLGFGDIVPKCGWLQMWVMLEVILGYIMLGGLISILAGKLAQRS